MKPAAMPLVVFPMRQRADEMEEYAAECRERAATVTDPHLKWTFNNLASQWEELAALRRRIDADRKTARLPQ